MNAGGGDSRSRPGRDPGTIMAMRTVAMHRFGRPPARRGLAGAFGMA
jgi:hypothetical protein